MRKHINKLISEALGNMFARGQSFSLPKFELQRPKHGFGDYSTNVAFTLAKEQKVNPNEAAQAIAREIKILDKDGIFSEIKAVAGFINFVISPEKISEFILKLQKGISISQVGLKPDGRPKIILFEYSSPNTNKPLHIGHVRNDVYGMACVNLLQATGHEVIATEVINDRGIHIMKSLLMYQKYGHGLTPENDPDFAGTKIKKPDHFVGKYYRMFAEQASKSEEAKKRLEEEAQELLQKWEANDPKVRKLWEQMNNWFYEGLSETYRREGSKFHGQDFSKAIFDKIDFESQLYDQGRALVMQGVSQGIFQQEADSSVYVDLSDQGLDKKYLLRKDGTTIYITQDMYLWHKRYKRWNFDEAIVVTSSEQAYHFEVLKNTFKLIGYPWAEKFYHLPYEHVYLGKTKMSSREGNIISADELFEIIKERVRKTMRDSKKVKASPDDDNLVEAVAMGAIKYAYLKYGRNTKIYFDVDQTVAIEGNTGPYLQYTYARIQSILSKAGEFKDSAFIKFTEPAEDALARYLLYYADEVVDAVLEFKPSAMCSYLFDLAAKFNTFYDQVSVLEAAINDIKTGRLNLLLAASKVLEHGLNILGIKAVKEI